MSLIKNIIPVLGLDIVECFFWDTHPSSLTSDTAVTEPAALITHPFCSRQSTAASNGHTRAVKILSAPTTLDVVTSSVRSSRNANFCLSLSFAKSFSSFWLRSSSCPLSSFSALLRALSQLRERAQLSESSQLRVCAQSQVRAALNFVLLRPNLLPVSKLSLNGETYVLLSLLRKFLQMIISSTLHLELSKTSSCLNYGENFNHIILLKWQWRYAFPETMLSSCQFYFNSTNYKKPQIVTDLLNNIGRPKTFTNVVVNKQYILNIR